MIDDLFSLRRDRQLHIAMIATCSVLLLWVTSFTFYGLLSGNAKAYADLTMTNPVNGQSFAGTSTTITGTATPNSKIRLYLDGTTTPTVTVTANGSGAWSYAMLLRALQRYPNPFFSRLGSVINYLVKKE